MSSESRRDHLHDLLAAKATEGLPADGGDDLSLLLAEFPEVDERDFDLAAASLDVYWSAAREPEELPESVKQQLLAAAPAPKPALRPEADENPFRGEGGAPWLRLYALAASVLLAFVSVQWLASRPSTPPPPPELARAVDRVDLAWAPQGVDGYEGVGGSIEWSTELQRGVMRLTGFPKNDAAKMQYQLWIVDNDRDSNHPVDGGVFDVSEDGVVTIPVDAKLALIKPAAFAITAEKPGGVVVSAGPHLAVAVVD